ncbi:hypothetical protein NEOC95_001399 [Neochlamydia sp. AcF95]|nr:hypothetical protein [Neochlamydia sp. AcF95]
MHIRKHARNRKKLFANILTLQMPTESSLKLEVSCDRLHKQEKVYSFLLFRKK